MRTLTRNTDKRCPVCNVIIAEHFLLRSETIGEPVMGGYNPVNNWVVAEFNCNKCGILFRPTEANGLVPFDREKVLKVLERSFRIELSRDLAWHEFLPTEKGAVTNETEVLKMDDTLLDHYKERRGSALEPYQHSESFVEDYLLIIPGKLAEHFSAFDREKKRPEEAVPARVVKKYNNDFECISYYVPEDAVKSAKG